MGCRLKAPWAGGSVSSGSYRSAASWADGSARRRIHCEGAKAPALDGSTGCDGGRSDVSANAQANRLRTLSLREEGCTGLRYAEFDETTRLGRPMQALAAWEALANALGFVGGQAIWAIMALF